MAIKRITRRLIDVVEEVITEFKTQFNVKQKDIDGWRLSAQSSMLKYPVANMQDINELWIDYEVQRDVIHKHVLDIIKKWDARICSPASACQAPDEKEIYVYDGQHRILAAAILGFTKIPCSVVTTADRNFASFAFEMLNDTGVKKLNPGDLHRNALVRYKNGSRDIRNVRARTMQDQFDKLEIDLQDKSNRRSPTLCGDNEYFFSHFKYAQKGLELNENGSKLYEILDAIKSVFPLQEEIDQGVFIGLYEIQRLAGTNPNTKLPDGWMKTLLKSLKKTFKSSHVIHSKARLQWEYSHPGASWSAPSAMSNFMRELHIINKGKLCIPYHGKGSKVGIEDGNFAPSLFPSA